MFRPQFLGPINTAAPYRTLLTVLTIFLIAQSVKGIAQNSLATPAASYITNTLESDSEDTGTYLELRAEQKQRWKRKVVSKAIRKTKHAVVVGLAVPMLASQVALVAPANAETIPTQPTANEAAALVDRDMNTPQEAQSIFKQTKDVEVDLVEPAETKDSLQRSIYLKSRYVDFVEKVFPYGYEPSDFQVGETDFKLSLGASTITLTVFHNNDGEFYTKVDMPKWFDQSDKLNTYEDLISYINRIPVEDFYMSFRTQAVFSVQSFGIIVGSIFGGLTGVIGVGWMGVTISDKIGDFRSWYDRRYVKGKPIRELMKKYGIKKFEDAEKAYGSGSVFYRLTGKIPAPGELGNKYSNETFRILETFNLDSFEDAGKAHKDPMKLLALNNYEVPPPDMLSTQDYEVLRILIRYNIATYKVAQEIHRDPKKLIPYTGYLPEAEFFPQSTKSLFNISDCVSRNYDQDTRIYSCARGEKTCYQCPFFQKKN